MLLSADPKASYLAHKGEIDRCVHNTLQDGSYILGPRVKTFEAEFAAYNSSAGCVGVANGTDAVLFGLRASGIQAGDAVATVSHTAVASVAAINWLNAKPVLVDINPQTYTVDPVRLAETLSADTERRIKAVLVVHLYGHPADMDSLCETASRHGAILVEDCAQAHGASYRDSKVGTMGCCGAFSFYPTKNLGAFGDGGAVISSDAQILERLRLLHQYGWRERYISEIPGYNSRLDALQAAILSVKLPWLDAGNSRRRDIAAYYSENFSELPIVLPSEGTGCRHVYHQYVIRSHCRDALQQHLASAGIGTAILYPQPIHCQPGYRGSVTIGSGGLAETERAAREILCLPIYPELTTGQAEQVVAGVRSFFAKKA